MKISNPAIYWTQIISAITQLYLKETTICVIWNTKDLDFGLKINNSLEYYSLINVNLNNLKNSFENDIADFRSLEKKLQQHGLWYDELTEKLTMAIEKTYCESFLVFQDDILPFIESFINASQYSDWRSKRNRFVFGYLNESFEDHFEEHIFFTDQDAILLVSVDPLHSHIFNLKTNKYYGPKSENQSTLVMLDQFNSLNETFLYNHSLFPDKIANLRGREIVVAGFDYRPYLVINYVNKYNNSYDLVYGDSAQGAVQIEGTEAQVVTTFCEIYNCKVLIDSSEATDWGEVYPNLTGDFSLGMVSQDKVEIAIGAMYSWDSVYLQLDMSMYLVRSGITCLVPAPRRLASWLLPMMPFQYTLWLGVLVYLLIEMISLGLTQRFESTFMLQQISWFQSLKFGFVTAVKLFLSQPGNSYIRSLTTRVLLFACFMNDIIITSIYCGGLASILTLPSYEQAADTIDGMLHYKLEWAANSEAWVMTLRNSDDERTKGILDHFYIYTDDELAELTMKRPDMGFTLERLPFGHYAIGDYLTMESIEHLKIMKEDLYFQYTVAFTKRCWPLLDRFDRLIYWWHSAGLDKYWEWRVVAANLNVQKQKQVEATMYANTDQRGPETLGMSNFIGILAIWFVGIAISMVIFLYELMENCLQCKNGCTST